MSVGSVADFYRFAVPAYAQLIGTGTVGRPRLEIEFAPGVYRGGGLSLGEPSSGRAIDLHLRAADVRQPPRLEDMTLALHGRRIHLAHLVFEGGSDDRPLLRVTVDHDVEIDGCAFIDNRTGVRAADRLLELVATGGEHTAQATIRASWFIRNYAPTESTLLAFDGRAAHRFRQIVFDGVAFLGNDAFCCVVPGGGTQAVDIRRCVILQLPRTVSGEDQRFMAVTSPTTHVQVTDSLVVWQALDRFVSRWSAQHPILADYPPATIRDSRLLLLRGPLAVPPVGYCLVASPVTTAGQHFDDLKAFLDSSAVAARRGVPPDPNALSAQLLARPTV